MNKPTMSDLIAVLAADAQMSKKKKRAELVAMAESVAADHAASTEAKVDPCKLCFGRGERTEDGSNGRRVRCKNCNGSGKVSHLTSREAKGYSVGEIEEGEDGNFAVFNKDARLPPGTKLYTHPAAQEAAQPMGMRDSFESWYIKEHTLPDSPPIEMPRRPDGRYGVPMRDISWIAWQAALQEAAQPMGKGIPYSEREIVHTIDRLETEGKVFCTLAADMLRQYLAALTAQPHAEAKVVDVYRPSDDEVRAWYERHDIADSYIDAWRSAIDDARSMHLLAAAPEVPHA